MGTSITLTTYFAGFFKATVGAVHAESKARVSGRLHPDPQPRAGPEVSGCPEGGLLQGDGAQEDPESLDSSLLRRNRSKLWEHWR